LQTKDDSIELRLFSDQKESETNHLRGVAALYSIHIADKLKQLKKNIIFSGNNKTMAANIGNQKLLEQSIINRVRKDLFYHAWRTKEEFLRHANSVNSEILQYGQKVLDSIAPVLRAFSDTQDLFQKLKAKNRNNNPLLNFLQDTQTELQSLIPIDFPEIYSFERIKELPRYLKAHALRMERGSLNLTGARKKWMRYQFMHKGFKKL
jgi:ATP-dependent helicase HrpA